MNELMCYAQNQDKLPYIHNPGIHHFICNMVGQPSDYSIWVEGAGPHMDQAPVNVLTIRTLTSHAVNERCLLFAMHSGHSERLVSRKQKGERIVYKNCLILVDECSDTSWLETMTSLGIVLENCGVYLVQSFQFRYNNRMLVDMSSAVPWAVCATPRLLVLALKFFLGRRIQRIVGSPFCYTESRYHDGRSPDVREKEIQVKEGLYSTADYLHGYLWLQCFLNGWVARERLSSTTSRFELYNSPLDEIPLHEIQKLADVREIKLPGTALFARLGLYDANRLFASEYFSTLEGGSV